MREIKFRAKNLYEDYLRVNKDDEELTKIEPGQIWVYGGYAEIDGRGFIFPERKTHFGNGDFWTDDDVLDIPIVDKNTLGQFTGMRDRSGKEIFEGDILRVKEYENALMKTFSDDPNRFDLFTLEEIKAEYIAEYVSPVVWDEGGFLISSNGEYFDMWCASLFGDMKRSSPIFEVEVVGNIYDNPELLKKD